MSKNLVVVTDSTAGLPATLTSEYGIPVIPLKVHWGEDTYLDGETLKTDTFYQWLRERKDFPSTSQPSAGEFITFFRDIAEQYDHPAILGIFIASELSGTMASANLAKKELTDLQIGLVDSRSVAMGLGLQVLVAARMAREGAPFEAVHDFSLRLRERVELLFAVNTLEYLHRGGRIGGAARLLGTVLNLKPVLTVEEGQIDAVEKVRSRRKSLRRIIEIAEERLDGQTPAELGIMHTGLDADVDFVRKQVMQRLKPHRLYTHVLTPVVGTHGGPGTLGIAFYGDFK